MKLVTLDEAKAARGARLVVAANVPSPWSEAAKGLFAAKGLDVLVVRAASTDADVKAWTGWHNVPVLLIDDEPIRTHWSEILEAVERMGGERSLVPEDAESRAMLVGLAHELLGENGLGWCMRLLCVQRGLETDGAEGFPPRVAKYLAPKYGCTPERVPAARARAVAILERFAARLEAQRAKGSRWLLGDAPSALDVYFAAAIGPLAMLPPEQCTGVHPVVRHAFDTGAREVSAAVGDALRAHRDLVYAELIGLPVEV